jgi:NADPH:quinone reductase-like Zn-dependent oxidoreductase
MRAITIESFDSDPALNEVPTPQIAPNEVLVRLRLLGQPHRRCYRGRMLRDMVERNFPVVLGRDFVGVVEQAGSEVTLYSEDTGLQSVLMYGLCRSSAPSKGVESRFPSKY